MNETYVGCKSGNAVTLNTSNKVVILKPLTSTQLIMEIANFEKIRIEEYWEALTKKSTQGKWVEGLNNRVIAGINTPVYFTNAALRRMVGEELKSDDAIKKLRNLPLEEQRRRLILARPEASTDLIAVLRSELTPQVIACDFYQLAKEQGSVENFVDHLFERLGKNGIKTYHAPRFFELLTLLWSRGYILFPFSFCDLDRKGKWEPVKDIRYGLHKAKLWESATAFIPFRNINKLSSYDRYFKHFLVVTDVHSADDMSNELITAYESAMMKWTTVTAGHGTERFYRANSQTVASAHYLRLYLSAAVPELGLVPIKAAHRASKHGGARTNGEFLWITERNPDLIEWQIALKAYVSQLKTLRTTGQIGRLNWLLDYICALQDPPLAPHDVVRSIHIQDVTLRNTKTWFDFVEINVELKRRTTVVYQARQFFDWYCDFLVAHGSPHALSFKNPILSTDKLGYDRKNRSLTPRNALPAYVLDEMKAVIVDNDFAFSRSYTKIDAVVLDRETNQTVKTWFPGVCICLYMMLEMPTRSHQARWLDSGELDELIYDAETNTEVRNTNPYAIPGRQEGVLRLLHDQTRQEAWLGLWINTNKTGDHGYTIPYVSDALKDLLIRMQAWKKRYTPPFHTPIKYTVSSSNKIDEQRMIARNVPTVSPLFCDPTTYKRHPVAYARLASFYTAVLKETQSRIYEKYGQKLQLVVEGGERATRWKVDLHSLRVSGLTSMIENGVPLEVVSQFVAGHATLVMTLHYLKFSPAKMRVFLAAAHQRAKEDKDFVGSELFMENVEVFEPFLLGQEDAGAGVRHLKAASGLLEINTDGICPGTSCNTGGPADSTKRKYTAVLGGKRCGLCRYWITGPAFLLGQVAEVNKLAYTIREKGIQVARLNEERIQHEDQGNQKQARNLKDRVETLNRELDIDLQEWSTRYKYASKSVELMDDYLSAMSAVQGVNSSAKLPMLTKSPKIQLKVTLERAHEFALIDHITQMSEFQTGFNIEAVDLKKQKLLNQMMAKSGLQPLLLNLDDKQAHEAGNLLSSLMLQQVRENDLSAVLDGSKSLREYPLVFHAIEKIEETMAVGELSAVELDSVARTLESDTSSNKRVKFVP